MSSNSPGVTASRNAAKIARTCSRACSGEQPSRAATFSTNSSASQGMPAPSPVVSSTVSLSSSGSCDARSWGSPPASRWASVFKVARTAFSAQSSSTPARSRTSLSSRLTFAAPPELQLAGLLSTDVPTPPGKSGLLGQGAVGTSGCAPLSGERFPPTASALAQAKQDDRCLIEAEERQRLEQRAHGVCTGQKRAEDGEPDDGVTAMAAQGGRAEDAHP